MQDVKKKAAEVLRAAAKIMNEAGAHWAQGYLVAVLDEAGEPVMGDDDLTLVDEVIVYKLIEDEYGEPVPGDELREDYDPRTCRFCAVGGLRQAVFGNPVISPEDHELFGVYQTAIVALADEVDPGHGQIYARRHFNAEQAVIPWNDKHGRTWEEVESAFLAAAEKIERA